MVSKRTDRMVSRTVLSPMGDQYLSPPDVWPAANSSATTDEMRSHSVVVMHPTPAARPKHDSSALQIPLQNIGNAGGYAGCLRLQRLDLDIEQVAPIVAGSRIQFIEFPLQPVHLGLQQPLSHVQLVQIVVARQRHSGGYPCSSTMFHSNRNSSDSCASSLQITSAGSRA